METVTAALLGNSGFVERQMVTTVFSLLGNSGLVSVGSRWCRSVLEYARRAVTVRRMALALKIVSKVVQCTKGARVCATGCDCETYGIGAENRVENRAVMVQCSVLEYARRAVTVRRAENRVQWCRTVRPVLDGVGRFSSMRDGL